MEWILAFYLVYQLARIPFHLIFGKSEEPDETYGDPPKPTGRFIIREDSPPVELYAIDGGRLDDLLDDIPYPK